ncbi:guanine deaminase [Cobetia amphilecti]|uniref:guanine deaminase n=1 Tax=Cobetia amphilecti TaxID=1055104 RepID=UPI0029432DE6|nr:guanine deaminase [Cobetia amphilecti]WOI24459.1 guanine deaminase [Cobetia amphilecti]
MMTDQDTSHTAACHLDEQRLTAALRAAAKDASCVSLLRGALLHFVADPADAMLSEAASSDGNDKQDSNQGNSNSRASDMAATLARAVEHYTDALLVMHAGHVVAVGDHHSLARHEAVGELMRLCPPRNVEGLMMPGFIDTHVHFPQLDIIASYGHCLIDWLNTYTFPAEQRFAAPAHAAEVADAFLDALLCHGSTSAQVFATSHASSADALFRAARARHMRVHAGRVMMDRNAPPELLDSGVAALKDDERLIADWHGRDRLGYVLTPRFAPTSTPEQLKAAGQLLKSQPDLHLQTHLAENLDEVKWVAELFPDARDYLAVYEDVGLSHERTTFAHGIHLDDGMRQRIADRGASIAFCPTSNLFLGSGLFDRTSARAMGMNISIATDVGGGSSLCQLESLKAAYQVGQLHGAVAHDVAGLASRANQPLTPWQGFYQLTLGNARAMRLQDKVGNLRPGMEADVIVLDPAATPLLARRTRWGQSSQVSLQEVLFALMMLGDDRVIREVHVAGQCRKLHGLMLSASSDTPSREPVAALMP